MCESAKGTASLVQLDRQPDRCPAPFDTRVLNFKFIDELLNHVEPVAVSSTAIGPLERSLKWEPRTFVVHGHGQFAVLKGEFDFQRTRMAIVRMKVGVIQRFANGQFHPAHIVLLRTKRGRGSRDLLSDDPQDSRLGRKNQTECRHDTAPSPVPIDVRAFERVS